MPDFESVVVNDRLQFTYDRQLVDKIQSLTDGAFALHRALDKGHIEAYMHLQVYLQDHADELDERPDDKATLEDYFERLGAAGLDMSREVNQFVRPRTPVRT